LKEGMKKPKSKFFGIDIKNIKGGGSDDEIKLLEATSKQLKLLIESSNSR
jgi:hypothetical protein